MAMKSNKKNKIRKERKRNASKVAAQRLELDIKIYKAKYYDYNEGKWLKFPFPEKYEEILATTERELFKALSSIDPNNKMTMKARFEYYKLCEEMLEIHNKENYDAIRKNNRQREQKMIDDIKGILETFSKLDDLSEDEHYLYKSAFAIKTQSPLDIIPDVEFNIDEMEKIETLTTAFGDVKDKKVKESILEFNKIIGFNLFERIQSILESAKEEYLKSPRLALNIVILNALASTLNYVEDKIRFLHDNELYFKTTANMAMTSIMNGSMNPFFIDYIENRFFNEEKA